MLLSYHKGMKSIPALPTIRLSHVLLATLLVGFIFMSFGMLSSMLLSSGGLLISVLWFVFLILAVANIVFLLALLRER